ncbi:maleylpyruvate isomerase family mycothiol-dependent enzyme [Rathayibacter sp. VKM Ac-2759]|uniref:maleylpyruvate isomerase family mycothiol-dependent enzyme n=1 Tax=Rathayibacter sp. VKM Ac-2759 TaxID=2609252 RepID=UPI0013197EA0|nr:maleylpyruvate isomerase family mycothiol-dependent enzyme [Rathayibacter sp. VKM Ac-2759]QHC65261.1 maleylpyruvate isomerase family mycothiol-dependent enzyme [Rathayibacter sp. VKM Ac-2759]
MDSAAMFETSATAFLRLLERIGDDQWTDPGLGDWDVRGLAGHTARAVLTVETYLRADDPGRRTIDDAPAYYRALAGTVADPGEVARRGVEAGVWLGDAPGAAVAEALERATALVAEQPRGRLVSIGGHGIELDEYLRTRVLELVVHTIDLSRATGIPHALPAEAVEACCALAGALAARAGRAEELLMALSGRERLAEGFSVV